MRFEKVQDDAIYVTATKKNASAKRFTIETYGIHFGTYDVTCDWDEAEKRIDRALARKGWTRVTPMRVMSNSPSDHYVMQAVRK